MSIEDIENGWERGSARASSIDYQESIISALIELGDPEAVPALSKFLDRSNPLYDRAVQALGQIGVDDAFEQLATSYLVNPDDNSGRWTAEALDKIDSGKFEGFLLKELSSDRVSTKHKNNFLLTLFPIASINSVPVLFPFLSDPDLSERAAWILSRFANESEVFEKAMKLTYAEDVQLKASAIHVLTDYFIKNPEELRRFEGSGKPVEVRRAVTGLYAIAHLKDRLLMYADDPDEEVRANVRLR